MRRLFLLLLPALFVACKGGRDPVIAKVGRYRITESEFRSKLADVAPDYQNYVISPNGRRQFLDVLIREKMVLAAAADSGVQRSPEFKTQFAQIKADEQARLAQARDYLTIRLWRQELNRRGVLSVSDEEVREHHRKHPMEVGLRHILLASADEAESALHKIQSGKPFSALAKSASLDAETAAVGGKMKPTIYGEIIPELEDVAFRMKTGETAGPVRSKFGYHLLRKESEHAVPFREAEPRIRMILEKQKLDLHLQSLQSRYPVEVVDAQFK